jgi:alpha-1,2-mannosyltransferase
VSTVTRRTIPGMTAGLRDLSAEGLLVVLPALFTLLVVITAFRDHWVAYDFHYSYYPAAQRLLDGGSPYAMPAWAIPEGLAFVYPALSAVVFAPFALLGQTDADHLYMLLCFLLVPATLWAAGVRDRRVYGLPMLWAPVILGWKGGNVSIPLTCLVALAWRYRDRPLVAGLITALAISLKPFVWPLALWLLVTRRWRAAGWAIASGLLMNLFAWAIVGFNQVPTYLRVSGQVTDALWRWGYGVPAIAGQLGLGRGAGEAMLLVASAALVAGVVYVGYARHHERNAMILSVALMLVASPLVWSHYFVLLLVPLALARPRVGWVWLLPCGMWVCPPSYTATGSEVAAAWLITACCVVAALRDGSVGRWPAGHRPQQTRPKSLATTG